jgi:Flp pilus assembly protein TadD
LYIRAPKPELYDLSTDPKASRNLAQSSKAVLDTMASQLEAFDQRLSTASAGAGSELSSSETQKLASLGYVGLEKRAAATTIATGVDPKVAIATANKAQAAMLALASGKLDRAISELQALVAPQPDLWLAQYGLGVAYLQKQQYAQAVQHLRKAIELQPESPWAHFYMGQALLKTGDSKTAAVHLEIASSRLPKCADAHTLLAEAYDRLGRRDDANQQRAKAKQLEQGRF